eukprot:1799815-Rhodomonas_salina.1
MLSNKIPELYSSNRRFERVPHLIRSGTTTSNRREHPKWDLATTPSILLVTLGIPTWVCGMSIKAMLPQASGYCGINSSNPPTNTSLGRTHLLSSPTLRTQALQA